MISPTVTGLASGGAVTAFGLQTAGTNSVIEVPLAASGTVSATATITLPGPFSATAIAVDPASGTIYVGGTDGSTNTAEVLVYNVGASGSATPSRTITPLSSSFAGPLTMAVDGSGQLYIGSVIGISPMITVFGPNASGAAIPVKTIVGGSTGLYIPTGIAIDAAGDIFVADADPLLNPFGGSIIEFAPTATGNAVPVGALSSTTQVYNGVAIDASGNLWTVAETETLNAQQTATTLTNPSIVEFAKGATGANPVPVKTIAGSATLLNNVGSLRMDSKGNVFVAEQLASGADAVLGFGPNATGNVAPDLNVSTAALTSGSTQFAIR